MKLYYHPNSPNSIPVLAVVHHLGIKLDLQVVNLLAGEQRKPDFLRLNPNGKVPALEDGDFFLWESNAVMQYLAAKKPSGLWPQDDRARADISRWQFWQTGDWGKGAITLTWERLIKKFITGTGPDPAEIKKGEELFHKAAAILNHHLEGRDYLVGGALTLADFSIAALLAYTEPARLPLENYAAIRRWHNRIAALDSWKKALPSLPGA